MQQSLKSFSRKQQKKVMKRVWKKNCWNIRPLKNTFSPQMERTATVVETTKGHLRFLIAAAFVACRTLHNLWKGGLGPMIVQSCVWKSPREGIITWPFQTFFYHPLQIDMGLSNHALIGLMFLALVGLGSAFPSDQEQKDETTNEDLMRPAYFDYDEASVIISISFSLNGVLSRA